MAGVDQEQFAPEQNQAEAMLAIRLICQSISALDACKFKLLRCVCL